MVTSFTLIYSRAKWLWLFNGWMTSFTLISLYSRLSRLQEVIAEQCEVAAVNQILVVDGELLEHTVDPLAPVSDYPACITDYNPIFVFLKSYPDHRYFPNCVYRKLLWQTFFGSIWTYILFCESLSLKKSIRHYHMEKLTII